jgi:glycine cleavage system H protein
MRFPADLKYTKDHEWAKIEGNTLTVGITDHAQSALGDVVFCELPIVGRALRAGETFGVVESIKAVSDLYSPVAGKVTAVNQGIVDDPARINKEAQSGAWMIKLEVADASSLNGLMDAAAYEKYVASLK